ncbi:MAG: response regulator [Janthinobacterium lividum]
MTTILVVDDEFLVGDVVAFALEDEGYHVTRAGNGRKAFDLLDQIRPALIITDYMMPVMNGLELADAVRASQGDDAPPIILMSGAQAYIGRAKGDVFAAVFDKPFRVSDIVASVHAIIGPAIVS